MTERRTITLSIGRGGLHGSHAWLCDFLAQSGIAIAVCDVGAAAADAATVDRLARLQLAARRRGCRVQLRHASAELLDLLELMGLTGALPDRR
jgi:ABC-type transporter Mla MlaB component